MDSLTVKSYALPRRIAQLRILLPDDIALYFVPDDTVLNWCAQRKGWGGFWFGQIEATDIRDIRILADAILRKFEMTDG